MAMEELRESLDHPIFFLLVVTIGVFCMAAILRWAAKAAGLPGAAHVLGG
jgi:hypothetical protein